MRIKNIGIVGFGLIGGSIGMAIKKYTSHNVYAFDNNSDTREYIINNNLCDGAFESYDSKLSECDIVFIGLYPYKTVEYINENALKFKKDAIVCDLCGVKNYIINNVDSRIKFIAAHPMAGKEVSGVYNASANLFINASFIIAVNDDTDKDALEEIKALAKKIGFGKIVETTAINHDKMITFTSQLPHVLSVAYVMQDAFKKCDGFYAGSFKDMARVAKINPYLWTELFKINKEVLADQIDEYIDTLSKIKQSVLSDNENLFKILETSKELKEWQDENYKN